MMFTIYNLKIWIWITIFLIIAILIYSKIPKKERKNKVPEFILMGIVFAIINVLVFQYVIVPSINPSPEITAFCKTGYNSPELGHVTIIEIDNKGDKNADSFRLEIIHPENEATPIKFFNPEDNKSCEIETFKSYNIDMGETKTCPKTIFKAGYRTLITCDSLPSNYLMTLFVENWVNWIEINVWADELSFEQETINCSWV